MLNTFSDLDTLIKSQNRLVLIDSKEETRLLEHFKRSASEGLYTCYSWNAANGIINLQTGEPIWMTGGLVDALRYIETIKRGTFVFFDTKTMLPDPTTGRWIKNIINDTKAPDRTLVIVGDSGDFPTDLRHLAVIFVPPLPNAELVREIYFEEVYAWLTAKRGRRFLKPGALEEKLIHALVGLTEEDVRDLLKKAIHSDAAITEDEINGILEFKKSIIGKQGLIDFQMELYGLEQIGGLENLKEWLNLRGPVFLSGEASLPVDPPKGILLLGVQGAGKSLAAKVVAGTWKVPLIHLDFSSLYEKWVGESEHNLIDALHQAEAMSPCVLWIDEIEKSLIGDNAIDSDGGLSHRILGTLLTWMSERKSRVFIVATANNVSLLPPELLRKGRFDEIFFVDLPSLAVRKDIFKIHLEKRKLKFSEFDLEQLARASHGFSGAEIEQSVVGGIYLAIGDKVSVTNAHVLKEILRTKPLSVVMAEKISFLRNWAEGRTVPASKEELN